MTVAGAGRTAQSTPAAKAMFAGLMAIVLGLLAACQLSEDPADRAPIREVMYRYVEVFNAADLAGMREIICDGLEAAYADLTAEEFASDVVDPIHAEMGEVGLSEPIELDIQSDTATASVRLSYTKDGHTETDDRPTVFSLSRVEGSWRVCNV